MNVVIYVSLLLSSCYIREGLSLKCWNCRSDLDPACDDPFDNATIPLTDCNMLDDLTVDPNRCRKALKREDGKWTTIRSCGLRTDLDIQGDDPQCITKSGPNRYFIELCVCSRLHGCNKSSTAQVLPLLLTTPIFLLFYSLI